MQGNWKAEGGGDEGDFDFTSAHSNRSDQEDPVDGNDTDGTDDDSTTTNGRPSFLASAADPTSASQSHPPPTADVPNGSGDSLVLTPPPVWAEIR